MSAIWTNGEYYEITAKAQDKALVSETPGPKVTFLFDSQAPTTALVKPTAGGLYSSLPTISGNVTDNASGISVVQIAIKNSTDTKWWSGTAFDATSETWQNVDIQTPGATSTIWTYAVSGWDTPKDYLIKMKGTDEAANEESVGSGISFRFDNTLPSSTIIT